MACSDSTSRITATCGSRRSLGEIPKGSSDVRTAMGSLTAKFGAIAATSECQGVSGIGKGQSMTLIEGESVAGAKDTWATDASWSALKARHGAGETGKGVEHRVGIFAQELRSVALVPG